MHFYFFYYRNSGTSVNVYSHYSIAPAIYNDTPLYAFAKHQVDMTSWRNTDDTYIHMQRQWSLIPILTLSLTILRVILRIYQYCKIQMKTTCIYLWHPHGRTMILIPILTLSVSAMILRVIWRIYRFFYFLLFLLFYFKNKPF